MPDATTLDATTLEVAPITGGPHDIEFFFDPGCPFAWQTSVWIRRVQELKGITVGWRFISLAYINREKDLPGTMRQAQQRTLRYHRICAAARERHGNDAVGELYRAWGERFWYGASEGGSALDRMADASARIDAAQILADLGVDADLVEAADDESWDEVLHAESDEAFRRTGPDVGTPILTYGPPDGNSLFGPVISSVPDDDDAVALYDALRVVVDNPAFSEIKRSSRAPLDLPILS